MRSKPFQSAIKATVLLSSVGLCGVAAATTSTEGQPNASPGLAQGLISVTGLNTANIIGGAVSSFASGGLSFAGGVNRFALPGQGETGAAGAALGSKPWNAWFAYSRSDVGYSFAPLNASGKVDVYLGGVDYTFGNNVVFGVAVAADRTDVDLHFNAGKLKGDGTTVAPYLGIALNRQWALDATIGVGRTNIDSLTGAGVAGSTSSDRTVASIGATFRHVVGKWQLSARGAYLNVRDKLGAYTLTNGVFVADGTVDVGQVRLYGQAAYDAGYFTPYVGLSYINDVDRPSQGPVAGLVPANDRDAWTPTIGLRFKTDGPVYGGIQYSSEQNRSEVKNNQILLNIGVRF